MSTCPNYDEDLVEVALGKPASAEFAAHLRLCQACAAELDRERNLVRRMDAAVSAYARTEPTPALVASVLARARSGERARPLPFASPSRWAWPGALGAGFALALLALVFGLHATQPQAPSTSTVAALEAWHSPTRVLLEPRGSVLEAPLQDRWFDVRPRPSHSGRTSSQHSSSQTTPARKVSSQHISGDLHDA